MIENEMTVSVPLEVVKASEIEPKEVKWLWYPYIPFGKVTLLQGDPGDGKSKLMLKEQESLMKELRSMLPEAAESFSSERIVCLCHVVDLWACIVALFEAPTPLSISKLRRLADSDMPLILLSSEIMEKESDFRVIEL